ncbi:MAG TPA: SIR2 family protein, partial [Anaerolineales bacterium]
WMPVLFMRLRSGRIWFVPGFGEEGAAEFKKWKALLSDVEAGTTTPILGGSLHERLYGSNRDLALGLADLSNYPLASSTRDALPQVTQYLSIDQTKNTLLRTLNAQIRKKIQTKFAAGLPADLAVDKDTDDNVLLLKLITFGGKKLRENDPAEPHRILARMKLPIYINTNYDDLLFDALVEAGATPEKVICPWNDRFRAPSIYDRQKDKSVDDDNKEAVYAPSPERPLVYHIFGHFSYPESMVLTEDDHFEFLIGATKNRNLIPPALLARLVNSGLMFLGFQLDDWAFRIFFRYIMDLGGGILRNKYANIAVQVDPDEMRNSDPKRARDYLDEYFKSGSINIYWGQSQDFAQALAPQLPPDKKENNGSTGG